MKSSATPRAARVRRHARVRKNVIGSESRPRLAVYRSLSHIYAQVINDTSRVTLVSASDLEKAIRDKATGKPKSDVATLVGDLVASRAKEKGITSVVFDRGGYLYHGRVKALADGAREGGLKF